MRPPSPSSGSSRRMSHPEAGDRVTKPKRRTRSRQRPPTATQRSRSLVHDDRRAKPAADGTADADAGMIDGEAEATDPDDDEGGERRRSEVEAPRRRSSTAKPATNPAEPAATSDSSAQPLRRVETSRRASGGASGPREAHGHADS